MKMGLSSPAAVLPSPLPGKAHFSLLCAVQRMGGCEAGTLRPEDGSEELRFPRAWGPWRRRPQRRAEERRKRVWREEKG